MPCLVQYFSLKKLKLLKWSVHVTRTQFYKRCIISKFLHLGKTRPTEKYSFPTDNPPHVSTERCRKVWHGKSFKKTPPNSKIIFNPSLLHVCKLGQIWSGALTTLIFVSVETQIGSFVGARGGKSYLVKAVAGIKVIRIYNTQYTENKLII